MRLESFSAGYWLAPDVEVTTYGGKHAIMQDDLFYELIGQTDQARIVGSAGGTHFQIYPERSVPDGVVAVPRDEKGSSREGDALLIAREDNWAVLGDE
jgi:hypothetical protein